MGDVALRVGVAIARGDTWHWRMPNGKALCVCVKILLVLGIYGLPNYIIKLSFS